jgi:O-antigen/teichoic acid export membrane protein
VAADRTAVPVLPDRDDPISDTDIATDPRPPAPPARRRITAYRGALAGGPAVLVGLLAWNLASYIFFLAAARILGPEDYGLVAALLAATVVVSVPCNALTWGVARVVAAPPGGDPARAAAVYRAAWRRAMWVSPLLLALGAAVVLLVRAADDATPAGPLILTLMVVAPMGPLFLSMGVLQGTRRYRGYALSFSLMNVPRPIVLPILTAVGLGVSAALLSAVVSMVAAAAVAGSLAAVALAVAAPAPRPEDWRAFARSLAPMAVGLTGLAVLTNVDVIAAKLALGGNAAGEFGAVAVLAKAVIAVPQALAVILLPRVSARAAAGRETGSLLALGVGATLLVGGAVSLLCIPFAEPLVRLAFGEDYVGGADLLSPFAAASTLLGALLILVNHHAGRGEYPFVWALGAVAVVELVLLALVHGSGMAIVAVDAVVGGLGLVLHEVIYGRSPDGLVRGLRDLARTVARGPAGS